MSIMKWYPIGICYLEPIQITIGVWIGHQHQQQSIPAIKFTSKEIHVLCGTIR